MGRPVSIKGVCALPDGRVLLCHNHRGDWELPGGRPEPDESTQDCLIREMWEETGLAVRVGPLLGTLEYEVAPARWVDVTGYACSPVPPPSPADLRVSDEHVAVAFVDAPSLEPDALPAVYRRLIARAAERVASPAAPPAHCEIRDPPGPATTREV
jgi:8-oxo-dGTP pyrophosphatase MutT (NUDIX family)